MRQSLRAVHLALLYLLFFGLFPAKAPSDPMRQEILANAPDAEEIALFEELANWIGPEPMPRSAVPDAIRQSDNFDLFRSFPDEEARSQHLEELPYGEAIRRAAERHGVDGLLVASVVEVESAFNPRAVSHAGAVGLMQLMPATAAVRRPAQLKEPNLNLDLGAAYLRHLIERFEGDLELALAAYNAGPTNVRRYGGVPPFRETQGYVEKVLSRYVEHYRGLWQESETGEFLVSGLG